MTVTRAELRSDINRELSDAGQPVKWSDTTKNAEINAAIRDSWPWWYTNGEAVIGTVLDSTLDYIIPVLVSAAMADAKPYAVEIEQGTGEPYMSFPEYELINNGTNLILRFAYVPGTVGNDIRIRYRIRQAELATDAATAVNSLRSWIVYRACAKLLGSYTQHTPAVNATAMMEQEKKYYALAEQSKKAERILQPVTHMQIRR